MNAEHTRGQEVTLRGPDGNTSVVRVIGEDDRTEFHYQGVVLNLHQFQVFGSLYVHASSAASRATVGAGDGAGLTVGGPVTPPGTDGEREIDV